MIWSLILQETHLPRTQRHRRRPRPLQYLLTEVSPPSKETSSTPTTSPPRPSAPTPSSAPTGPAPKNGTYLVKATRSRIAGQHKADPAASSSSAERQVLPGRSRSPPHHYGHLPEEYKAIAIAHRDALKLLSESDLLWTDFSPPGLFSPASAPANSVSAPPPSSPTKRETAPSPPKTTPSPSSTNPNPSTHPRTIHHRLLTDAVRSLRILRIVWYKLSAILELRRDHHAGGGLSGDVRVHQENYGKSARVGRAIVRRRARTSRRPSEGIPRPRMQR